MHGVPGSERSDDQEPSPKLCPKLRHDVVSIMAEDELPVVAKFGEGGERKAQEQQLLCYYSNQPALV